MFACQFIKSEKTLYGRESTRYKADMKEMYIYNFYNNNTSNWNKNNE